MTSRVPRIAAVAVFAAMLAFAALQEVWPPAHSSRVRIVTDPPMPARLYLFKGSRPFRFAPVDAVLPVDADTFYRDRLFLNKPFPALLEVVARDQYHTLLLAPSATVFLPAGKYRIEAYRGLFYTPVELEFEVRPQTPVEVKLSLKPWDGADPAGWISSDDHIHLTRDRKDDSTYLRWLAAEDLTVGNFLALQRQMDAAPQYAFGRAGEARQPPYTIRSGQELRNEFWGHTNILGASAMVRPMSTGSMYANTPESYPWPSIWFAQGRKLGGLTGYAHFFQKPQRSTLYMDAALGNIDFVEVFQFGVLRREEWYELLNAGFRVTGIAGSDFPVPFGRFPKWPRWLPLLGPERALVKARPGEGSWERWARGVREGNVVVSNGPIVELTVDERSGKSRATAAFFRPLEELEIVRNGQVVAATKGDGTRARLQLDADVECAESCWIAARTRARTLEGEPVIQAHTNPVYRLRDGKPVQVPESRRLLAAKWQEEIAYFRSADIVFPDEGKRREFFEAAEKAWARMRP